MLPLGWHWRAAPALGSEGAAAAAAAHRSARAGPPPRSTHAWLPPPSQPGPLPQDCLRALLAVLMNLTQSSPAGCAAVVAAGGLAPAAALLAQLVRGGPKIRGVAAAPEELLAWLDEMRCGGGAGRQGGRKGGRQGGRQGGREGGSRMQAACAADPAAPLCRPKSSPLPPHRCPALPPPRSRPRSGCLALLINVVEHDASWRQQLRSTALPDLPSSGGGTGAGGGRVELVPLLCTLLAAVAPRSKQAPTPAGARGGRGKGCRCQQLRGSLAAATLQRFLLRAPAPTVLLQRRRPAWAGG